MLVFLHFFLHLELFKATDFPQSKCLDLERVHNSTVTSEYINNKAKVLAFANEITDKCVEDLHETTIENIRLGSLLLHLNFPERVVQILFELLQQQSPRDGGELRDMFFNLGILGVQLSNPSSHQNDALYDPECTVQQRDDLNSYALESQPVAEQRRINSVGKTSVCLYFDIHRSVFDRNPELADQLSARVSLRIMSIIRKLESDVLDDFHKLREILDRVEGKTTDEPLPMAAGDSPEPDQDPKPEEPPKTWEYTDPWVLHWQVTLQATSTDIPTQMPTRLMVHERRRMFRSLQNTITILEDDSEGTLKPSRS